MKDNAVSKYVRESFEELHSVTWPTKNQMIRLTIIVLSFTFVSAAFLALIDYLFNQGNSFLLSLIS